MKKTIIALLVVLTSITVNGQTVKDYFIPASPNNKSNFYSPNKTGGRTEMTRTIYYIKRGNTYDITNSPMYNSKPSAIQTMTVEITTNSVIMIKSTSTTMFETNKKKSYNPTRTILKMPAAGQTINWTYIDIPGDKIKCLASWTKVNINGVKMDALKVVKQIEGFDIKTIEYYVKGIGLWKTEMKGDGITQTSDKFDGLQYDPTVK